MIRQVFGVGISSGISRLKRLEPLHFRQTHHVVDLSFLNLKLWRSRPLGGGPHGRRLADEARFCS